ncbi:hypothetical protein ACFFGR_19945 [Arthrobacter liuii]|uniref:Uncharacterized protein n=1 Tax=Arthrobacter liuii TaxID=1476996 RepID=A0ABQ2AG04_9MICC|nr:hypothetical protein [Arthrobacter liuii]GGH90786.1 hypothetical protein GCM10007170_05380 [Arthrobacter liuii]
MTTRAVASLLRMAWLLAGTLAVIAGLLGMHVMASSHASHGAVQHGSVSFGAPAGHTAVAHSAAGDHAGGHAGHLPAASAMDAPALAPAGCGDTCPGAKESGAPCIPSAPSGPVTVVPPQATLETLPELRAGGSPADAYDYLPPSPTPCDLSISRT